METLIKISHYAGFEKGCTGFSAPDGEDYKFMYLEVRYTTKASELVPLTIQWGYKNDPESSCLRSSMRTNTRLNRAHTLFRLIQQELGEVQPTAAETLQKMLGDLLAKVDD